MTITPISFHGKITEDVFVKAQRLALRKHMLAFFAFAIIVVLLVTVTKKSVDKWDLIGVPLGLGVALFFLYFLQVWKWRRIYRRSPYLQETISGSLSDQTFLAQTATAQTDTPWDSFIKAKIGRELVLLYRSPVLTNIVSKQFFLSDDDWQLAVKLIRKKISGG
jgi:hypothetical protein